MFRIEMFCDDKKLPFVLHSIAGLTLGDPKIHPVINAARSANGGLKQITNGNLMELFGVYLQKIKVATITPKDAQGFLKNSGRSPSSASYLLRNAVEAHLLKRGPGKSSKATYLVVPQKGA